MLYSVTCNFLGSYYRRIKLERKIIEIVIMINHKRSFLQKDLLFKVCVLRKQSFDTAGKSKSLARCDLSFDRLVIASRCFQGWKNSSEKAH